MAKNIRSDISAIEALRSKGYKATPQRIAICRIALKSKVHPSAQQVYEEVRKIHPTVSLATVYKTLEVLRDLDLVQEINHPKGQARFDPNMNPHINLICSKCGHITDLDDVTVEGISRKVAAATDFKPTGQRIDVYGICKKCGGTK
ncbi:MAG: transcriptional repressor [Methanomassiliicoccales archaeon]|jgi:Fur family peroxide stress response transcriptional regulator|nr:transcriptional repressor [Methanomassiliicoccales archaeon]